MTLPERAEMYRSFLAEEGYVPKIDDDFDILFKFEGQRFFINVSEDEQFFRIILPNFWAIESDAERVKVMAAALVATSETKVAKVFPVENDTWASLELFCSPPESFKAVFPRCMNALTSAVNTFREEMNK